MQNVKSQPFPLIEVFIVTLILVGFILFSIFISLNVQPVWLDEVTVADPAVNLYLGHGFTSTGWQYQTKEEFWASNAPLHQILLYHWLLLFGFNPISVRSINFVLMALALFLIWLAVYRLNLVTSLRSRLTLIALLIFGSGITINYRTSRYDCIGISLFAALFLAYSIKQPWLALSVDTGNQYFNSPCWDQFIALRTGSCSFAANLFEKADLARIFIVSVRECYWHNFPIHSLRY